MIYTLYGVKVEIVEADKNHVTGSYFCKVQSIEDPTWVRTRASYELKADDGINEIMNRCEEVSHA